MNFYRYEAQEYASMSDVDNEYGTSLLSLPHVKLKISEYVVIRETPKGYWIGVKGFSSFWSKWVSKTARKRYAYPTREEALNNFIKRTEKRIKILNHQLLCSQIALDLGIKEIFE